MLALRGFTVNLGIGRPLTHSPAGVKIKINVNLTIWLNVAEKKDSSWAKKA